LQEQNGRLTASPSADSMARALEDYLAAVEAGAAPPRDEFLARYPELAEDLEACLAALRFIGRAAEGPRSVVAGFAEPQAPEQAPGQLGDFRLIREVGRGGMGVVYEAEQVSLKRRVALKVLPFAATMDPRQLQRFHNEVRAAASLDHPNIVHVHAVGCERAVHFYAMQFIEGQTVAAMIADLRQAGGQPVLPGGQATTPYFMGQPVASAETAPRAAASTERSPRPRTHFRRMAELGIQAAEALDHAHSLGIVHRDVKPANMMVDGRGCLWVTDFGLAHIQSDARLTMTGDLVGTLRYMSPEQALAKRVVVDHRTDVYSLGATLYELLTLEPVFAGGDRQELLRQIAFEEPRPPRRILKAIPAELETIVQKAMEKNPADRYATAKELANDLRRFLADEPIRARPAGVARRLRKWGRRNPAITAAALAALAATVIVLSGGVGWVVNDQATRTKATETEVNRALDESVESQRRRRVPEALSAARRAQAALAGGHADAELRRRAGARVFDLDLLARLEDARLESTAGKENHFDFAHADRRNGEIFQEFHLDLEGSSALEAGMHIRDSTVALELAAFFDHWAMMRRNRNPQDEASWKYLLNVARAADPDGWRTQVRDALAGKDREVLVRLASADEAVDLLPWTLYAVAQFLKGSGDVLPAEALLRQGQRQHPDDFWINEELGLLLQEAKPSRHDEAIPFLMVAVALRPQSPAAHSNLGVALADRKDLEGAIAEYGKAIGLDPKGAVAHYNLGNALHDKNDLDGAIAEYRKAIDLDPKLALPHSNLGNALHDKNDLDGEIAEYRKAIDLDPRLAHAHDLLGCVLRDKKDLDGAIAEHCKAIDLDPKLASPHSNLGNALRDKKDLEGAIAEHRKAIDLDSKFALPHNGLGNCLLDKNDLEGAIAEYRKAIDLDSKFALAHSNLGNALHDQNDLDGAIAEFRKAIEIDPKNAGAHSNLGRALHEKNDLDGAIAEFRKAIDLDPKYALAHNGLGCTLRGKGDLDGAIAEYRKAIDLDPKLALAHNNLGVALADRKDLEQAIAEYRKAIDLDPKLALAHSNLGTVLRDKNDLEGAIAELRKAIDIDPRLAIAHINLGNVLGDKKDLDGAIAEYRKAIDIDPKSAIAHSNLGIALADKNDAGGAIAEFRKAIEIDPKNAGAHHSLGIALAEEKDAGGAIVEFRKAIDLDPEFALAYCNLAVFLRGQGQFAEAMTNFRRGHELGSKNPRWPYPSAQWIKECERLVELDAKLPDVLSGKEQPADAGERAEYAHVCQKKHLYSSAARLYREALGAQPALVASPSNGIRYNAACAAALAGCGTGEDSAKLTDAERAGLRKQALDWLRADLDARRALLDKDPAEVRPTVAEKMRYWQSDVDFKGVRDPDALGKLPDAERKEWQKLWVEVGDMLAKTQEKTAPAPRSEGK
jgi:tetratricopeptide (TPR) repeat protein/serine/threonine protein kinase